MGAKMTLNTRAALADFKKFDKKTGERHIKTLKTYAQIIAGKQKETLRDKVKNWTGNLASKITPVKKSEFEYWIGPLKKRVVYAWFIEMGSTESGGFKGYHYVAKSLEKVKDKFITALKRDIERF